MGSKSLILSWLVVIGLVAGSSNAFTPVTTQASLLKKFNHRLGVNWSVFEQDQNPVHIHEESERIRSIDRRLAIGRIVSTASVVPLVSRAEPALALNTSTNSIEETSIANGNIRCLLDLPPVKEDCVRLYLCRHGQTENNRRGLVQGARVDPPLNDTGRRQAVRLGESLYTLKQNGVLHFPELVLHSTLRRARETATILSLTVGNGGLNENEDLSIVSNFFDDEKSSRRISDFKDALDIQTSLSLSEVDFGSVEGKTVTEARAEMMMTFGAWAVGRIDASNGDDGETGRSVLNRIESALNSLTSIAASNGGSLAVVTHSTYLRMLLLISMEAPLFEASSLDQNNCCINVLDVSLSKTQKIRRRSKIFGGDLSVAPNDFELTIPRTTVVRVNEIRHLEGLL